MRDIFAGPAGPVFSFSAFLLPARLPPCVEGLVFSHPGSPVPRIRPQPAHTPSTGSVGGFPGVASLPRPQNRTQGRTGPSLDFLSKTSLPLPLKGEGLDIVCLVCQVFHPEKPGAFPQEKTDASHPRASLGSCLWQPLATTGSHGSNRACSGLRWCRSPTRLSNRPYIATQGRIWFSPSFPGALLLRKFRQLAFQVIIHRLVNGQDCVKQRSVSRGSVQCPHRCRHGFNETLVLQLGYVLPHRVGTHACAFSNYPKARVAQVRFPVLAKQQVGVHGDLPSAQSQGGRSRRTEEKISPAMVFSCKVVSFFSVGLLLAFQSPAREAFSLFYAAQLLRGGYPFFLGKRKAGIACGHRIFIQLTATLGLLYLLGFML